MELDTLFLTLGAMFAIGLAADQIGRRTPLPRVTLLLLCGLVGGQMGWLPQPLSDAHEFLSVTALTFVAFLLGGSLSVQTLRSTGKRIFAVSISIVLLTLMMVAAGLVAVGTDPSLAIVLAGIATATAPVATSDVIRQSGVDNVFTRTLAGVVAVDDAWGLIAFSLCLAYATSFASSGEAAHQVSVSREIFGALAVGLVIGVPGAMLTGRIVDGEPLEVEALALVFLTAGLALWAEVSFLIAGMAAGAVIVNMAAHHDRTFHEIEHIQWPFIVMFFLLAGTQLDVHGLGDVGLIGLAYITLRTTARIVGGWMGAAIARATIRERRLYGIALLPQAGVAVGMALVAAQALPELGRSIIALTIGATIAFELVGPFLTLWAIRNSCDN